MNRNDYSKINFEKKPNFNERSVIEIEKNDYGLDNIYLVIDLPELPDRISYKQFAVYDLLKYIGLEINGIKIFGYNSDELWIIDECNNDNFYRTSISNRHINYNFNLGNLFKKSKFVDPDVSPSDINYCGLRLGNYLFGKTFFVFQFGSIIDMVNSEIPLSDDVKYELSQLQIIDAHVIAKYKPDIASNNREHNLLHHPELDFDKNMCNYFEIVQHFCKYSASSIEINPSVNPLTVMFGVVGSVNKISQLIIYCDTVKPIKLNEFSVIVKDGKTTGRIKTRRNKTTNPKINKFEMNMFDVDNTKDIVVTLNFDPANFTDGGRIYFLFKTHGEFIYKNSMIGINCGDVCLVKN